MAGNVGILAETLLAEPKGKSAINAGASTDHSGGQAFKESLTAIEASKAADELSEKNSEISNILPFEDPELNELNATDVDPRAILETTPFVIASDSAQIANADLVSDASHTPSQPGPAFRPLHVQVPVVSPFPQSAAAVYPSETASTFAAEIEPTVPNDPLAPLQSGTAPRPSSVPVPAVSPLPQQSAAVLSSTNTETASGTTALASDTVQSLVVTPEIQAAPANELAPQQTGSALRPLRAIVPATSPLRQSSEAVLNPNETAPSADVPSVEVETIGADAIEPKADAHPDHTDTPAGDAEATHRKQLADLDTRAQVTGAKTAVVSDNAAATTNSPDTPLAPSQAGPATRPSPVHIPAVNPIQQSPAAVLTSNVENIPNILADSLSADDGTNNIKIQLDPPELGRVSIDFKFDGNVLQNVVVTGETPEAMRRLRLMHFELVQTLESFGYSGQDLDFSQRDSSHNGAQQAQNFSADGYDGDAEELELFNHPVFAETKTHTQADGLNLKL